MNKKSIIISVVVVFLLSVSVQVYSKSPWGTGESTTSNSYGKGNSSFPAWDNQSSGNSGGTYFAPPDDGSDDDKKEPPPGLTPIGESLALLSLLSGGYFILKRRNSEK